MHLISSLFVTLLLSWVYLTDMKQTEIKNKLEKLQITYLGLCLDIIKQALNVIYNMIILLKCSNHIHL